MPAIKSNYELLDFGDGRKLERFGEIILNRPCPAAERLKQTLPELWASAAARFRGPRTGDGSWSPNKKQWQPADWRFVHEGRVRFSCNSMRCPRARSAYFPSSTKIGIGSHVKSRGPSLRRKPAVPRVLNLFAYTGGSTLAAAAAGASVVHVDAAQSVVERASGNAALSGLAERPIRWIVEDAVKFCRREVKRGNKYEAVILDPPTYGHGPKGEPWKIGEDLLPLLELCGELTAENRKFVLVSCHSPGIGPAELGAYLADGIFRALRSAAGDR